MSVTTVDRRVRLTGLAATTWSVPLPVMSLNDVSVFLVDTTPTPDTVTEIFAGIDFTLVFDVIGVFPSTFSLTLDPVLYPVGLAAGEELRVVRSTAITQDLSFSQGDTFPESALELVADKLTLVGQDAVDRLSRALRGADSDPVDTPLDLELPSVEDRAQRYLSFDNNGVPTATTGLVPPTEPVSAPMTGFLNSASLIAARAHIQVEKWEADTAAARAATTAAAFGIGFWYETDTNLIFYSDGAAWTMYVNIGTGLLSARPAAGQAGRFYYATDQFIFYYDNGATWDTVHPDSTIRFNDFHIGGYECNWVTATSWSNNIGSCIDSANAQNIINLAAMTKVLNVAGNWTPGGGNNGVPSVVWGAGLASQWFRIFVIRKNSTGAVDFGIDSSAVAANLLAESGYDVYRRIGWLWVNPANQMLQWFQPGDPAGGYSYWLVPQLGFSDNGVPRDYNNGGAGQLITWGLPIGVSLGGAAPGTYCDAIVGTVTGMAAGQTWSLVRTGQTTAAIGALNTSPYYDLVNTHKDAGARVKVASNTLGQMIGVSNAANTIDIDISVRGWWDTRGQR